MRPRRFLISSWIAVGFTASAWTQTDTTDSQRSAARSVRATGNEKPSKRGQASAAVCASMMPVCGTRSRGICPP